MTTRCQIRSLLLLILANLASAADDPPCPTASAENARRMAESASRDLIAVASDEKASPIDREKAIRLLGDLKSRSAPKALLELLLFESEQSTEFSSLAKYPAARALVQIGSTIYPDVWARLFNKCSDRYITVVAFTMVAIDGQRAATARIEERLLTERLTEEEKKNLDTLLSKLKNTNFKDPVQWPLDSER